MKIPTGILALLLPVTAIAQNYPGMDGNGMSESDMQNMMQQAQKMPFTDQASGSDTSVSHVCDQ